MTIEQQELTIQRMDEEISNLKKYCHIVRVASSIIYCCGNNHFFTHSTNQTVLPLVVIILLPPLRRPLRDKHDRSERVTSWESGTIFQRRPHHCTYGESGSVKGGEGRLGTQDQIDRHTTQRLDDQSICWSTVGL